MKKWYHCHQYRVQNDLETFVEMKIGKLSSKNKKVENTTMYNFSANVFLSHMGSTYLVFQIGTSVAGGLEMRATLLHLNP